MYKCCFKRILDIFFSFLLIILLSPLLLLISILVRIKMGHPILFIQERVGINNNLFSIYKFRTMNNKSSGDNSDANRLTKLGKFLRKSSFDEFPQLFNILKGDMSFIGPRPLLKKYIIFYNNREIRRHEVRPGMTSLAGIKGRSNLLWEEQFEYDVAYVENLTFMMDLTIFIQTIPKVLGSTDMMVIGRKNTESFDVYRKNQLEKSKINN